MVHGRLVFTVAFLGVCLSPFAASEGSLVLRVWIAPPAAGAVHRAALGARRKLKDDRCRVVLSDFVDASGRSLQQNLDQLGLTAADYLTFVILVDAEDRKSAKAASLCRNPGTLAFTTPGSRVVNVCTPQFVASKPWAAENALIHEMLHTLGLGENPPSSTEITHRVKARCGS